MPRGWPRAALLGAGLTLAMLTALSLVNDHRLGTGSLLASVESSVEQAKALGERARPEYQELALATLPPNPNNGEFIRLDDMLDRAVLREAPLAATSQDDGIVYALEFDDPASPGLSLNGSLKPELAGGFLRATSGGDDDYLASAARMSVPQGEVGDILLRVRADRGTYMRLAWIGEDGAADGRIWRNRFDIRFKDHEGFHTYVINARNILKRGLKPGENLTGIFLLPADTPGANVEIDFIRFISKTSSYLATQNGIDFHTIGDDGRHALYMRPDQTLEFEFRVPRYRPRLTFGTAVLLEGRPLGFSVTLTGKDGATVHLYNAEDASASAWREVWLDLSPWADRDVRLGLSLTGDPANVGFWSSPLVSSAVVKPFNIVMLVEDAQRADYLSVYGHPRKTTPFKERLVADQGVVFARAITQAEKTRPSVASYMTSLYPTATGLWHFSDVLSERHLTLAEILRSQGYATASFIQNGNAGPYAGLHQGFERLIDMTAPDQAARTLFTAPEVSRWLQEHRDRNFFLYLHAIDPHAPYDPPPPYREAYSTAMPANATTMPRDRVLDPEWVEHPSVEGRRLLYEGEILRNDAAVAGIFATLDRLGLRDDTLVVMTSDHGEYLGERSVFGNRMWDHRAPGYLAGTHVPLMLFHPKLFNRPRRVDSPVPMLDLMPTLMDLAAVDRTDLLLQGRSLLGLLADDRSPVWRDRVIVSEEPTAMSKSDPCTCGSLHYRDWHLLSSTWVWPRDHIYFPHAQAFLTTFAFNVAADNRSEELDFSFLPDLLLRIRQRGLLADLRDANIVIWKQLTDGEAGGRAIDQESSGTPARVRVC